jgi:hypothetical protein
MSGAMSSSGHQHHHLNNHHQHNGKADSSLSRLGCALATQLQLTAAKTSGTLASLTHRLSRHNTNGKQSNKTHQDTSQNTT